MLENQGDPVASLLNDKDLSPENITGLTKKEEYELKRKEDKIRREEEKIKLRHARSQSFAQLKVTNLTFPFNCAEQGSQFIRKQLKDTKQQEAIKEKQANKDIPNDREPSPPSASRRRPNTAGRIRMHGMDIFNNQLISQKYAANQMSASMLGQIQNQETNEKKEPEVVQQEDAKDIEDYWKLNRSENSSDAFISNSQNAQYAIINDGV